ncbi:MAG: ABC transporter substrate-binding protein [Acidimicrobiia bacterium]|nr:ABC transporter substrate-binding protein [Acidimicrobiia bacterium]
MKTKFLAVALAMAMTGVACSNASSGSASGGSGQTQGVKSNEIDVGGLAALSGPLGDQYGPIFDGAQAYFDMINEQGGVNGRKIKLVAKLDDATDATRNASQARALNEQNKVFAVIPVASPLFAGGTYLSQHNVPTFGWHINPEWSPGPSMFGQDGSYIDFTGVSTFYGYLAHQIGAKKIAIFAYTASQSRDCATGAEKSFKQYGFDVAFNDSSLAFGTTSLDADVQRVKDAGVDFVTTCMDVTGNTLLSKTLRRAGLGNVRQFWPTGYDAQALAQFADLYEGVYFRTGFVPFEEASTSPGMTQFMNEMKKRFPNTKLSEVVVAGWINADLFVNALRAVGKDVTRQKVIDTINAMTNYSANQIEGPVNWTIQHTQPGPTDCDAYLQVQHGKFTPIFKQPFVCYPHASPTIPNV